MQKRRVGKAGKRSGKGARAKAASAEPPNVILQEALETHRYEQALAREAARNLDPDEEAEPLPKSMARIVERHDRERRKLDKGLLDLGTGVPIIDQPPFRTPPAPQLGEPWSLSASEEDSRFSIFWLSPWAQVGGGGPNSESGLVPGDPRSCWGRSGTASLSPNTWGDPSVCYDDVWLGYAKSFSLEQKRCVIYITSTVEIRPSWIEALSFGKASFGRVTTLSFLNVDCSDSLGWPISGHRAYNHQPVYPMCGVSPPGNHQEGKIGVFHPSPGTQTVTQSLSLSVDSSQVHAIGLLHWISLRAERLGRIDRCNAVLSARATWGKIRVMVAW